MKNRLLLPLISAVLCGYGVQQEGQEAALEAKIGALEARLTAVEGYLQAQASGASALDASIDSAVAKGYTAGINFEARQELVAAWKRQIQSLQQGVPGAKVAPPAPAVDPRVQRRTPHGGQ